MSKFFLFSLIFSFGLSAYPQSWPRGDRSKPPITLTEPFFGLIYDARKVHFDPVPQSFVRICSHTFQHEFVYAHLKSGDAEYFVISGYSSDQDGDSLGYVAMLRGNVCDAADLNNTYGGVPPQGGYGNQIPVEQLPGKDAPLVSEPGHPPGDYYYVLRSAHEEAILRGLLRDSFQRGIRAFGGETQFKRLLCTAEKFKAFSDFSGVLTEQELKSFCSNTVTAPDRAIGSSNER